MEEEDSSILPDIIVEEEDKILEEGIHMSLLLCEDMRRCLVCGDDKPIKEEKVMFADTNGNYIHFECFYHLPY